MTPHNALKEARNADTSLYDVADAANTAANAAPGAVKGGNAGSGKVKAEADGSMTIKVNELVKVIGSMLFPVGSLFAQTERKIRLAY
jgi:hypothetical protein